MLRSRAGEKSGRNGKWRLSHELNGAIVEWNNVLLVLNKDTQWTMGETKASGIKIVNLSLHAGLDTLSWRLNPADDSQSYWAGLGIILIVQWILSIKDTYSYTAIRFDVPITILLSFHRFVFFLVGFLAFHNPLAMHLLILFFALLHFMSALHAYLIPEVRYLTLLCIFFFISNGSGTSSPFWIAGLALIRSSHALSCLNSFTSTPAHSAQLIQEKHARSAIVILSPTIHGPLEPLLDCSSRRSSSTWYKRLVSV